MQRDQEVGVDAPIADGASFIVVDADDLDLRDLGQEALPARRGVPVAVVRRGQRGGDDSHARQRPGAHPSIMARTPEDERRGSRSDGR